MHDFTIDQYILFVKSLQENVKSLTLIHDVDLRPEFAVRIAGVEAEMGVRATYYFRSMHFRSHAETIKAIVAMGHEAGYHYESLTTCKGDIEAAYKDFCRNLETLRGLVPVRTACAHGSPRSPWNSQSIWNQHDIHELGIDYEPMMDTDFSKTLYLTDTGRRWDGYRVSVRDKVPQYQEQWEREGLVFHTTEDIIHAISDIQHPIHHKGLLINTHPQRWMPFGAQWVVEAGAQWWKNQAKRLLVLRAESSRS
ncbi:MAG: hypothetical protein IJ524_09530 [Bacteroidales bacterium]|nr:hypothetical protein [Bacteroidales bacterium]